MPLVIFPEPTLRYILLIHLPGGKIEFLQNRFKFATSWKWMRMKAVVGGVDLRDGGIEDDFEACFEYVFA